MTVLVLPSADVLQVVWSIADATDATSGAPVDAQELQLLIVRLLDSSPDSLACERVGRDNAAHAVTESARRGTSESREYHAI